VIDKHPCRLYNIKVVIRTQGGVFMSICPKNKTSRGRRDKRRANWKMSVASLAKCPKCGELMLPHRVCKNCGTYNKREIVTVE